jgi:GT2 family glycosyltransferase/glycosyltransferase involved in cell wall biosynthesis
MESHSRGVTHALSPGTVDIVVPVYGAPDDVRRCVDSVLRHTSGAFTLVLIDDASPDSSIATLFAEIEQRGDRRIELLRNATNLGFTETANRGMSRSRNDVVLLNSDTVVTRGWLDALLRCAASDPRIATVTPFSNNAEICSFPRFCENNVCESDSDAERIRDALADAAVPTYPDLPTGVGFCMLIRRAAIDELGAFDLAFGAGYGEENDFCLRAANAGWRNVLADDAFVVHTGERSFAGRKRDLAERNMDVLLQRHPHYAEMVRDYVAADPLRALREVALSRLSIQQSRPRVLHVIHDRGGGTEAHVRALVEASGEQWDHYAAIVVGDRWQLEERTKGGGTRWFGFERRQDESWHDFIGGLVSSFAISLVHVHQASRAGEGVLAALPTLDVPYGVTIHDLWFACPTTTLTRADDRFCGGVTDRNTCNECLRKRRAFEGIDIGHWRDEHAQVLAGARYLIAPSRWAADMLARYFPQTRARIDVIPHATLDRPLSPLEARPHHAVTAVLMPDDATPTVAIVGAIGPDKGSRRIGRLARRVRERAANVRFVVIGYVDVQQSPWQSDDSILTVHGRYSRADLPQLLAHYRTEFVLYPSEGPESFSYTLSEIWRAGKPALVPPIGALAERVLDTGAGWLMSDVEWSDDDRMLDRVLELLAPSAAEARRAATANARAV